MSFWNTIRDDIGSIFGHKKPMATTTPSDPEAPIKSLMRNAPKTGNANIDANHELKQQLLDGSFKKGGKVKKTGVYRLHKGEVVVPKKKAMAKKMGY